MVTELFGEFLTVWSAANRLDFASRRSVTSKEFSLEKRRKEEK
jgi:hypothetical protein